MKKTLLATCITLIFLLVLGATVFAQADEPAPVTGSVVGLLALDRTVVVEVDGDYLVFTAPEDFDLTMFRLGDGVELETGIDENGERVVVSISLIEEEPEETETPTEEPTETPTGEPSEEPTEEPTETPTEEVTETPTDEGAETPTPEVTETPEETETPEPATCPAALNQHPVGWRIANTYGLEYDEVMGWFCDGFGFGEIMLALQTSRITEMPAEDLLQWKVEQGGWGQVWQGLGLIGNGKKSQTPTEEPVEGEPTEPVDGEPTEEPVDGDPTEEMMTLSAPDVNDDQGNGRGNGNAQNNGKPDDKGKSNNDKPGKGGRPDNPGNSGKGGRPDNPGNSGKGKN